MNVVKENIFIAWGGNQPLAKLVGQEVQKHGYISVVGGGAPTDTFIGTQVFSQIKQCTQAIILVEGSGAGDGGSFKFNDNLMFEWGYLTAKLQPNKIHVFLINMSVRNLPSDLSGSWATEVDGKSISKEELAVEIAGIFNINASKPSQMNKLEIFHSWENIKRMLDAHIRGTPECSECDMANYLLHSIEPCYYNMEEEYTESLLQKLNPSSPILGFAIQIMKGNFALFTETNNLLTPLSFDKFDDLKSIFESQFDFSVQDDNLNDWFKYFCAIRLSLVYRTIAINPELLEDEKQLYLEKSLAYCEKALESLNLIRIKFPHDASYVKLYEGYLYRDIYIVKLEADDRNAAKEYLKKAVEARKSFYLAYKQTYPQDAVLIKSFAQEYYLALIDQVNFSEDKIEAIEIKRTINSFLQRLEKESVKQYTVLEQLRKKCDEINNK
ncbi:nucleotide-binding protein [Treponema primitia]|uniref:TIR domain-containing protein n=1 Tax=Treponema primitia TaxID=88058 RepID=UPI003980A261